ncbi:MAG: orotate phosphoribosyltransferase, partial [Roseiflexaceae bacterium]|nr:orotate phosphoribosyltransferase [Roseiflexaceae bacterium]
MAILHLVYCEQEVVMTQLSHTVAQTLLQAGAVVLRPDAPFTFASGMRSPIYCDNRVLLGNLQARRVVVQAFAQHIGQAEVLAGPATGAIPWVAWVSELCGLPMAYVRSEAKAHGRGQQIEGADLAGRRLLLLEDTVSTGASVLKAAEAVRSASARL